MLTIWQRWQGPRILRVRGRGWGCGGGGDGDGDSGDTDNGDEDGGDGGGDDGDEAGGNGDEDLEVWECACGCDCDCDCGGEDVLVLGLVRRERKNARHGSRRRCVVVVEVSRTLGELGLLELELVLEVVLVVSDLCETAAVAVWLFASRHTSQPSAVLWS